MTGKSFSGDNKQSQHCKNQKLPKIKLKIELNFIFNTRYS